MIILIIQCGTKMDYTMCMFIIKIVLMNMNILIMNMNILIMKIKLF